MLQGVPGVPLPQPLAAVPDSGWPPDNGLTSTHIEYHEEEPCLYPPTVLDFLPLRGVDRRVVDDNWPCEVRAFWVEDMKPFVDFVRFLYTNLTLFLVFTGLLLNCFALRVLSSRTMRGTSLAVYLKALSVSDMCALLFTYLLGYARSHLPQFNAIFLSNAVMCRLHKVLVSMFPMTSQWLQTALTLERLLVVWRPMRAPNPAFPEESARLARRVVAFVYTLLIMVALSKWYFSGFEQYSAFEYARCDLTSHSSVVMVYVYVALSTYLPGTLIFVSNVLLVLRLRRTDALRRSLFAGRVPDGATYQTDAAARTLLLFSLLYLVLQLPLGVVETVELYWDVSLYRPPPQGSGASSSVRQAYVFWLCEKLKLKWARTMLFWLFQLSFVLNFVVYLNSASRFRGVAKALTWRWTRRAWTTSTRAVRSFRSKRSDNLGGGRDLDAEGGGMPLPLISGESALVEAVAAASTSAGSSGSTGSDSSLCSSSRRGLRSRMRDKSGWRQLSKVARLRTWTCAPRPSRSRFTLISEASLFRRRRSRIHTWSFFRRRNNTGGVRATAFSNQSSSSSGHSQCSPFSASSNTTEVDSVFEAPFSPAPARGLDLPGDSLRQPLVRFRSEDHVHRLDSENDEVDCASRRPPRVKFERFLSHQHRLF